jgi:thermostable 8-oxoguanine DNA glycosylase
MLEIDVGKITFIITKSREFEAQSPAPAPDGIAEEGFDGNLGKAEFRESAEIDADDATYDELKSWIRAINHDDQCQIVALAWVGRGDFGKDEWDEALKIARDEHNNRTAEYLLGMPLLSDYLEDGLSQFELSYAD